MTDAPSSPPPRGPAVDAYLALGSNLGDREAHLAAAVDALHALPGVRVTEFSKVYETALVGPPPQDPYLHYALDLWFETEVRPRLRGRATLIRYADDFVIGFEHEEDARRVLAVLGKRLGRFGLNLHPDKTRLLPFRCPPAGQKSGKGLATFDFLGFTLYWARSRRGCWGMACEPETGDSVRHGLVPSPSAPSGKGSARGAHEATARPLQLLRRQRELSQPAAARPGGEASLVQVAVSSQPAQTSHLGAVR